VHQKKALTFLLIAVISLFLLGNFSHVKIISVKADNELVAQPMHFVQGVDPLNRLPAISQAKYRQPMDCPH